MKYYVNKMNDIHDIIELIKGYYIAFKMSAVYDIDEIDKIHDVNEMNNMHEIKEIYNIYDMSSKTNLHIKCGNNKCIIKLDTYDLYVLVGKDYFLNVVSGKNFAKDNFIFELDEYYESIDGFKKFLFDYRTSIKYDKKIYNPLLEKINIESSIICQRFDKDIYVKYHESQKLMDTDTYNKIRSFISNDQWQKIICFINFINNSYNDTNLDNRQKFINLIESLSEECKIEIKLRYSSVRIHSNIKYPLLYLSFIDILKDGQLESNAYKIKIVYKNNNFILHIKNTKMLVFKYDLQKFTLSDKIKESDVSLSNNIKKMENYFFPKWEREGEKYFLTIFELYSYIEEYNKIEKVKLVDDVIHINIGDAKIIEFKNDLYSLFYFD